MLCLQNKSQGGWHRLHTSTLHETYGANWGLSDAPNQHHHNSSSSNDDDHKGLVLVKSIPARDALMDQEVFNDYLNEFLEAIMVCHLEFFPTTTMLAYRQEEDTTTSGHPRPHYDREDCDGGGGGGGGGKRGKHHRNVVANKEHHPHHRRSSH
jgi:hypothetical protein